MATPEAVVHVLSDAEFLIYSVMSKKKGVCSRIYLRKQLVDKKLIGAVTFSVTLDGSPIIRYLDRGVFMLRGWPLDAALLRSASLLRNNPGILYMLRHA